MSFVVFNPFIFGLPTPDAPVASFVTDHLSVAFTLPAGATSGNLYKSTAGGPFVFLANVTTSPYSDTSFTTETDYAYKLSAVISGVESGLSGVSNTVAVIAITVHVVEVT
jgi:hypothetical protein